MTKRIDKHNYYLNIAQEVLKRGTCIRRNYGAVIVNADEIVSTGYSGAPRGCVNCCDTGICERERLNIPSGERYELCKSVHAEVNACIQAARRDTIGATLYLVGWDMKSNRLFTGTQPCAMCQRVIINAGIEQVIIRTSVFTYQVLYVKNWRF